MTDFVIPESWRGKPLLTVDDLAPVLGCHTDDVYRMASHGEIPSFKLGARRRFRTAEIVRWLLGATFDEAA
jgi:excisionase family DNA binding protein